MLTMIDLDLIRRLFISRSDAYAVQNDDGTYTSVKKPLTDDLFEQHLKGEITLGPYQINPKDNTVKFVGWDIDNRKDGLHIAQAIVQELKKYGLQGIIEPSGSPDSYHVWLFCNPTDAAIAYDFGRQIVGNLECKDIEVFPKQRGIEKDGYGNLIKLPLGKHRKTGEWCYFLNPHDAKITLPLRRSLELLTAVKPCDLPDVEYKPSSSSLSLDKLRPCFRIAYEKRISLNGGQGDSFRLAAVNEMIAAGCSDWQIHQYFNIQPDYDEKITQEKIDYSRRRKYKPHTCKTIQKNCPDIVADICSSCFVVSEQDKESEKKAKRERDIYQVMQLPDWGLNGKVVNPIQFDKDVEGERKTFLFKVYVNENDELKSEEVISGLFIPPTGMTPSALELDNTYLLDIFKKLRALNDLHIYFTEDIEYDLQTLAAMSSYFREVFDTYPYMDYFSAENGVGKTHGMLCLIWASFHGFAMVIPTQAVLFRSVEDAHATVGIDEVHKLFKNPKQNQDLLALLLSGHTKGIGTYRMDMNAKPPRLVPYDPFGLKAYTRKEHISIDLLSRSITFHMMSARKRKSIEEHLTPDEFAECRNMMYVYRLRHWQEVRDVYDELREEKVLEVRQADLFLPLLTIAKMCSDELYERVLSHAREDEKKRSIVRHDDRLVVLIELLKDEGYSGAAKVVDIRRELNGKLIDMELIKADKPLSSQTVIGWLDSLGFDRSSKRSQGYVHYVIDAKRLDLWYEDITIEREPSPTPQKTSLSSLNLTKDEKSTPVEHAEKSEVVNFGEESEVIGKGREVKIIDLSKSTEGGDMT